MPEHLPAALHITDDLSYDLLVVGGGLSGVCAAIAAARKGVPTALLQDRSVLGGNSSSEVRVHPVGASSHGYFRDARETGLMEEIFLEARARSYGLRQVNGAPYPMWDMILLEKVQAEPNLTLYLSTRTTGVEMADPETITAILAVQLGTEKHYRFRTRMVIDASGDGMVAFQAGAPYRYGREASSEFNERRAPEQADDLVLGSSMMFAARDAGRPVPFIPPVWASKFPDEDSLPFRAHHHDITSGYWWIEWGGALHTIADNDTVRQQLTAAILGVWDHIKNHCTMPGVREQAANLVLDWIGQVPGKRESRRFEGDYILTENDIEAMTRFPDQVAYGGWPIDLHPADGVYSRDKPCDNPHLEGLFGIPFRSLYSRTIKNLLLAGRAISATHVAHGATRVQKTCAVVGQASGTAAVLCLRNNIDPPTLSQERITELQQMLLKDDCYLIGVANQDQCDLAHRANVSASSQAALVLGCGVGPLGGSEHGHVKPTELELSEWLGQALIVKQGLDRITLQLRSSNSETPVRMRAYHARHLRDFSRQEELASVEVCVPAGTQPEPVTFKLGLDFGRAESLPILLVLERAPGVFAYIDPEEPAGTQLAIWNPKAGFCRMLHGTLAFELGSMPQIYHPHNVISGVARPEADANCWISQPGAELPQWIALHWPEPVSLNTIMLTFDSNLSGWIDEGIFPELVRDYRIEVQTADGAWQLLHEERNNYQRRRIHHDLPVSTQALRLVVTATNGAPIVRVYEIRVYNE